MLQIIPDCHHTYPKTDNVRYSLAYTHNSYSHTLIFFSYCTCDLYHYLLEYFS